ncbi:MAG TPA: long-chain fatty acid--CoA ligase [Acidimicrobiia bacterium]
MQGTMQSTPLTTTMVMRHGLALHAGSRVLTDDGTRTTSATFAEVGDRAQRLASALRRLGVGRGDRVATLAWNHQPHLEAYFAVPGMGAVLHTLNLRLFPEQLAWIVNHAEDRVLLVDDSLTPLLAKLAGELKTLEHVVVIGDGERADIGETLPYEELLAAEGAEFPWPAVDESDAATMCYTSGTTGNPKGVVYTHRSVFLHVLAQCGADAFAISQRDRILLVVPMFHANAWGLPYAGWMAGSHFVLPGPNLSPTHLAGLIRTERITFAEGVPTIWNDMLLHTEEYGVDFSSLRMILSGGSAVPRSLIEAYQERFGVALVQAWGMTETGPLAAIAFPPPGVEGDEELDLRARSGRIIAGIEVRTVDESGAELPWDGVGVGELEARGPWVTASYYQEPAPERFHDGWLRTGDVGTIDRCGFIQLTDRLKDVIKSGGEWISSVDLESRLMAHPEVVEAAVIAVPDPRWQERPLACVVRGDGSTLTGGELAGFLSGQVASWWIPERWSFLPAIPKTSVGKFDKKLLRARHADGLLVVTETDIGK